IRALRSAAGILSKAALVGAKTVNGPGLDRRWARPALWMAAVRVVKSGAVLAAATMSSVGATGDMGAGVLVAGSAVGAAFSLFWLLPQAASVRAAADAAITPKAVRVFIITRFSHWVAKLRSGVIYG